jgi:hypothetical protein
MSNLHSKCFALALAALVSLSFTPTPSRLVDAQQGPQGAGQQKKADDDSSFVGIDDLALVSWPGLATVGGLATLPSPLGSSAFAPGKPPRDAKPTKPPVTQLPGGRVMPTAPVEPLSPFMP